MEYSVNSATEILRREVERVFKMIISLSLIILVAISFVVWQMTDHMTHLLYTISTLLVVILLISIALSRVFTRKIRNDISTGRVRRKRVVPRRIVLKSEEEADGSTDYRFAIATNIHSRKMHKSSSSYIITDDGGKYLVPNNISSEKQVFILYFGAESKTYLGCK